MHVCYSHSPMRYAWDQFDAYFGPDQVGKARSRLLRPVLARWPGGTPPRQAGSDRYLANSQYVAGRIRRYYNRGSTVVYPPVDTDFYRPATGRHHRPFPGRVGARPLQADTRHRRLPAGWRPAQDCRATGPEEARLRGIGRAVVEFLGWSDEEIARLYRRTAAVLCPARRLRHRAGGGPGLRHGRWWRSPTAARSRPFRTASPACSSPTCSVEAFADGLARLVATFDPVAIRRHAEQFSRTASSAVPPS